MRWTWLKWNALFMATSGGQSAKLHSLQLVHENGKIDLNASKFMCCGILLMEHIFMPRYCGHEWKFSKNFIKIIKKCRIVPQSSSFVPFYQLQSTASFCVFQRGHSDEHIDLVDICDILFQRTAVKIDLNSDGNDIFKLRTNKAAI